MTDEIEHAAAQKRNADDWMAKSDAYRRRAPALRPGNKAVLFAALTAAGITHVLLAFDGFGDSGQTESIEAEAGDKCVALPDGEIELALPVWGHEEPDRQILSIAAAIEHIAFDCLAQVHDGWENGDGAFGVFAFDVAAGSIALEFNARFTAHHTHPYRF